MHRYALYLLLSLGELETDKIKVEVQQCHDRNPGHASDTSDQAQVLSGTQVKSDALGLTTFNSYTIAQHSALVFF